MYKQHIISCRVLDAWFCLSFNYIRLKPKSWMFLLKSKNYNTVVFSKSSFSHPTPYGRRRRSQKEYKILHNADDDYLQFNHRTLSE